MPLIVLFTIDSAIPLVAGSPGTAKGQSVARVFTVSGEEHAQEKKGTTAAAKASSQKRGKGKRTQEQDTEEENQGEESVVVRKVADPLVVVSSLGRTRVLTVSGGSGGSGGACDLVEVPCMIRSGLRSDVTTLALAHLHASSNATKGVLAQLHPFGVHLSSPVLCSQGGTDA